MLHATGPCVILLTSAVIDETPSDVIDMMVSEGGSLWRIRSPRLGFSPNGAGDLTAALFLAHYLRDRSAPEAMAKAASSVHAVLEATLLKGGGELALIVAQDALVAPQRLFIPEPL
jgi:pyridoxine kinase